MFWIVMALYRQIVRVPIAGWIGWLAGLVKGFNEGLWRVRYRVQARVCFVESSSSEGWLQLTVRPRVSTAYIGCLSGRSSTG